MEPLKSHDLFGNWKQAFSRKKSNHKYRKREMVMKHRFWATLKRFQFIRKFKKVIFGEKQVDKIFEKHGKREMVMKHRF